MRGVCGWAVASNKSLYGISISCKKILGVPVIEKILGEKILGVPVISSNLSPSNLLTACCPVVFRLRFPVLICRGAFIVHNDDAQWSSCFTLKRCTACLMQQIIQLFPGYYGIFFRQPLTGFPNDTDTSPHTAGVRHRYHDAVPRLDPS
jgi:hypothetical protein